MDKNKKTALLLYGVLGLLVISALIFILRPAKTSGMVATIQVGSQKILQISLDHAADTTFTITKETGLPISFEIKDHAIRFVDSNCPDKVCINFGFLRRDMDIASCLPNDTVLFVTENEK